MGNIQGLYPKTNRSKLPFITETALEQDLMLIALTESHLRPEVRDAEVRVKNYTSFRRDRNTRSHGGVITYVRDDLASTTHPILSHSDGLVDLQAIHMKSHNLLIINCYRPPSCTYESFKQACNKMHEAISTQPAPMPNIIICGDFNFPFVTWPTAAMNGGTKDLQQQANLLLEVSEKYFLSQIITKPTRKESTLDLFFTNNQDLVHSYTTEKTIFSDHCLVTIQTSCRKGTIAPRQSLPPRHCPLSSLNFLSNNIEWDSISNALTNKDWDQLLHNKDVNEMLDTILDILYETSKHHVPTRRHHSAKTHNIPRDRKILMRNRSTLNKRLEQTTDAHFIQALKTKIENIELKLKASLDKERKHEEYLAVSKIKHNPKYFFSYCSRYLKSKARIGPLTTDNGTTTDNPKEMAEHLLKQYESVFSTPSSPDIIRDPLIFYPDKALPSVSLADTELKEEDFVLAIMELSPTSAPGPDGVPAALLRRCATALAKPLLMLWRRSLDTSSVPTLLKQAVVTPIHKGGDKSKAHNYRPVALTSHLIKVFEKILRNKIMTFMEDNNLFNNSQHGFRKGRSCLSKLLSLYDHTLHHLSEGNNVDIVFLDFAKAFDKVDHGILLHKMKRLGITGKIGRWLHNFLTSRSQKVTVEGHCSESSRVISGVPQGSVLGPLLFLVLMGDIDQGLDHSTLSSFADDTNISHVTSSEDDIQLLQQDLDKVYLWAQENNMTFNEAKFEALRCGPDQDLKLNAKLYTEGGHEITPAPAVKCLGVSLSEDCSFHHHIAATVNKAKSMAGWVLRTFTSRDQELMLTVWRALIQPILDYCSQLWSPHKKGEIQLLESVQRSFSRYIAGTEGLNYWQRLEKLGLYSQQRRRDRYSAIYTWKILEQLAPDPTNGTLLATHNARTGRRCQRTTLPSGAPQRMKTLLSSSFTHNGPRIFNVLPKHNRELTGCPVNKFKRELDKVLRDLPDTPPVPGYTALCRAASNSIPDQAYLLRKDKESGAPAWL